MLEWPDPYRMGVETLKRAASHAAWEQGWWNATGQSWQERVQRQRIRDQYKPARFDVTLDPIGRMTRITATGGIVRAISVNTSADVGGQATMALVVPLEDVTVRTNKGGER